MNYLYMPCILKESSEGTARYNIVDELFQQRQIFCIGEIDSELAAAITMQLRYLDMAAPGTEINMFIDSPGGEVQAGLAIYDAMRAIESPVRTICTGWAASMGALLFAAGDKRDILPHAAVMIHDPLIPGGIGGSALKIDSTARNIMKTREITAGILGKHTGRSLEEIYKKTAADSCFDAEEAVAWGLADRIITTFREVAA